MTEDHLITDEITSRLFHKETYPKFLKLKERAKQEGIDLYVLSSFRSFENQLSIWNKKCRGEKTLLDSNGTALNYDLLTDEEVVFAILRWSALPGTSRHHWGTDIDVVDKNTWPEGYHIELIPGEFSEGAMFYKMKCFFDRIIAEEDGLGFFRPYEVDQEGVAPEMWHISDFDVAQRYFNEFTLEHFLEFLDQQNAEEFLLLDIVKNHAEKIFQQYIQNIYLR
ncbi:serine-type D-Ala-D-Ala carboxypeptidase [Bacteriovorax sp. Seq25_V]|nr:serine-type D-Ala-D-Ala carboxypeptidase [Bacteriovorax sp. Seq25_V]